MAILNIRNLPDDVYARLRVRAARSGRSMEAEARAILTAAVRPAEAARDVAGLQEWVDQLYGRRKPRRVVDDFIAERHAEAARE
jgi:plasmid stability protein